MSADPRCLLRANFRLTDLAVAASRTSMTPKDLISLFARNLDNAATKLAQEHLSNAFARETGATVASLRYHNVYGPRMPRDTPYAVGTAS